MQLKGTTEGDSNFLVQVPFCVDKEVVEGCRPFQSQLGGESAKINLGQVFRQLPPYSPPVGGEQEPTQLKDAAVRRVIIPCSGSFLR